MAFEGQIDKLIEKLTDLTRADKVIWKDTAAENTFLTGVGKSVVIVGRTRTDTAAPCFIRILDDAGKTIEEAFAPASGDSSLQDWDRLRTLYELGRRSALKSDKIVSDLLSTLEAIR
jgi:hypothetical protein